MFMTKALDINGILVPAVAAAGPVDVPLVAVADMPGQVKALLAEHVVEVALAAGEALVGDHPLRDVLAADCGAVGFWHQPL
jgi:hypothetical protein